ncbi:MAG TPA: CheR family methyltransferase [Candidatus Baltobacteraceae bacterium]|nr:CheR family methyltransferase [Candidatus Baltobacteraceae bacterium]
MVEQVAVEAAGVALNLRRDDLADIELQLLLDALVRYGACDFRGFNQAVLRRRVADAMRAEGVATISGLQERLLHDERAFASFVVSMRSGTAQPFTDPSLLRAFVANVVPLLRTYSFVRVWVPGAGPGADAYTLAAILDEAGILARTIIYATFANDASVAIAKAAMCRHSGRSNLEAAARMAGLERPLSEYFEIDNEFAVPKERLRESVMFARHNPASDASINEFHAIVARGFLPLLNGAVQYRLHSLLFESLMHLGFLALGTGETIAHSAHEGAFRQVSPDEPIFRRLR